jgi:3-dehydroquinate dehydratase II
VPRVVVMYGPNLNSVGTREPQLYGSQTLDEINSQVRTVAESLNMDVEFFQSNHEGALIDKLQEAGRTAQAVVLNPGGFGHTSVALRDAVAAIGIPVVECHLSNIARREPFRHTTLTAPVCHGVIFGFGPESMVLGVRAAEAVIRAQGR